MKDFRSAAVRCTESPAYFSRRRCRCLAVPCLFPRQTNAASVCMRSKPARTLCPSEKSTIGNRSPATPGMTQTLFAILPYPCQIFPGPDRSSHSIRAAARVARSLAELLLRFSLLFQFGNTSAPGVDEPVAYLITVIVSSFAPRPSTRTDLSHGETRAPAEHLLLLFRGVGMSEMLLEPLFEQIRNIPREVASSFLRHLRSHVFRLELHRPVIAVLVLMSVLAAVVSIISW